MIQLNVKTTCLLLTNQLFQVNQRQVPLLLQVLVRFVLNFKGINHEQTILRLLHKCITPIFIKNIWPDITNYSLRAKLQYANFTEQNGATEYNVFVGSLRI